MLGSKWRVLQNWMRKNCHVNHEMLGYNEYLLAGFHHEILFFFRIQTSNTSELGIPMELLLLNMFEPLKKIIKVRLYLLQRLDSASDSVVGLWGPLDLFLTPKMS